MSGTELGIPFPKRKIPWERKKASKYIPPDVEYYIDNLARKRPKFRQKLENKFLDLPTKRAAKEASDSVVALVSFIDGKEFIQGSGTIIQTDGAMNMVLTSANIFRRSEEVEKNSLPPNLKITVYSSSGSSYQGEVVAYDYHYNICVIGFQSQTSLSAARVAHIDDSMVVDLSVPSQPPSRSYKLVPGDGVIVVGRYFHKPYDLMAAPGPFKLGRSRYDCKELFVAECSITRCGDGGPLINYSGEVIGVTYFHTNIITHFLPINIAKKWWEHFKQNGLYRRPLLGIEATNLYVADVDVIERVVQKFPDVNKGVIVEKVIPGSAADLAGLRVSDVIIKCGGETVHGFLEYFEMLWDKVGCRVELVVVRESNVKPIHLNMLVVEATPAEFNRWPIVNKAPKDFFDFVR